MRFRQTDLQAIRVQADKLGLALSTWIRQRAMERVEKGGPRLNFSRTAHGHQGEQHCIRFTETEYARAIDTAEKEGTNLSAWLRALAVQAAGKCTEAA